MDSKFVLLIVEGESDESFFGEYLEKKIATLEAEYGIEFLVTDGDELTSRGTKKGESIIRDLLKKQKETSKLMNKDFLFIIQITDLDGSYFNADDHFEEDFLIKGKPSYEYDESTNKIRINPSAKASVMNSWTRKKSRQEELSQLEAIEGIPYCLVYNSLYLEHVLLSRLPRDYNEKENCIDQFLASKVTYEEFERFFESVNPCEDFVDSWDFIKSNDPSDFKAYSNVIHSFNLLSAISE